MNSEFSSRHAARVVIALLLLTHAALGIDASRRLTVTHDEYWHVAAGFLTWKTGRFDFDPLNPPLTRLWATWPLLFTKAHCDATQIAPGDLFGLGRQFLLDNAGNYEFCLALARSMNVIWSILAGLCIALWSREVFGDRAACLATALWAFCPTALANAALVTPDAGGASLFVATLYVARQFAWRRNWRSATLVGALLGLAQLAKFTNLLLFPLVPVVAWLGSTTEFSSGPVPRRRRTLQWLAIAVVSLAVLNAGYWFRGSFTRWDAYAFQSQSMRAITDMAVSLHSLPLPFPNDYLSGLDRQRAIMEASHPVYLDGTWSLEGFPDYYLRALAYKVPHAVQLLSVVALLFMFRPGQEPRLLRAQTALLVPPLFVVGVASTVGMQLGLRYILPAFPTLFVFAGQTARWTDRRQYPLRTLLVAGLALVLPFSLRFHPHHLAYFNELSGGPLGGRLHLLDSNLDWGQDLGELKQYLARNAIDDVGLAYFGMYPPANLGIRYHVPTPEPAPGWYAVSANFLFGRPHTVCEPDGTYRPVDFQAFAWLRFFQPVARIGYSIDVYNVTENDLRAMRQRFR